MIKITMQNVTKMSEDGLYLALADMAETNPMYLVIEAELDRRASLIVSQLEAKQKYQAESLKLTQQVQSEIQQIFSGFRGKKTLMLIENFGQEFIDDYIIDENTHTVYSKISYELFNNPVSWECDSSEQAHCKLAKLLYDRVYDKMMRNPTRDSVDLLKKVLGE